MGPEVNIPIPLLELQSTYPPANRVHFIVILGAAYGVEQALNLRWKQKATLMEQQFSPKGILLKLMEMVVILYLWYPIAMVLLTSSRSCEKNAICKLLR